MKKTTESEGEKSIAERTQQTGSDKTAIRPFQVNVPEAKLTELRRRIVSVFPDEIYLAQRSWEERAYPKLIHYNKLDKGGHLRGMGTAEALFRRGSRVLQIAAVGFFTREEEMRHV